MPTYKISQLTTATAVSATNQFEINQNGTSKSVEVSVIDAYIKSTSNLPVVVSVSSATDAVRITQTGTGNALVVEDSANPDATPTVITKDGDVIIGGTAAISSFQYFNPQLFVMGGSAGGQKGGQFTVVFSNDTVGPSVELGKSRSATVGTVGTIVQNGDELGIISFNGDDGTDLRTPGATIRAQVDGTPGLNDMPGRLVFSTTADGASSPTERMRIGSTGNIGIGTPGSEPFTIRNLRNFSGATTAYGISQGGEVQSGVTSTVYVNHTAPTTQAAAFNISNVYHYGAVSLSLGAGSTVTNQYGFVAQSGLTAATNNYGFWSNIASGTGRWNFYAAGTADNFFGGPTTISTSSTSDALRITQTGTGKALVIEDSTNPDSTPIVVDADGRLLVGTTTNVASTTGVQVAQTGNNVTSPVIDFTKERAGATVIDGQGLGTVRFWGYDGTAYRQAASIIALVEGTPGTNVMPSVLQLRVRTATGAGDTPRLECLPWGGVTIGSQPGSGPALSGTVPAKLRIAEDTYTDTASAASATIATGTINSIQATAVAAANTGVTYTNLSTLYIQGAPTASTNVTITNPYALYVVAGASYFGGQLQTAAGTAAAPAISTIGDTNTGMFFPAADTLAISTAGTERMRITSTGNVVAGGSAALATTATDGFLYVPTCAGTPTGTPTTITGMAPIVINTTNNKLYFYSGGAWRDAGP